MVTPPVTHWTDFDAENIFFVLFHSKWPQLMKLMVLTYLRVLTELAELWELMVQTDL